MAEKAPVEVVDKSPQRSDEEGESFPQDTRARYDANQTKKLLRKLDTHIMPVIIVLYLLSFLDRTNIGNARLAGLEEDLNMTGLDYNVCMT
jgi:hypothetical protein